MRWSVRLRPVLVVLALLAPAACTQDEPRPVPPAPPALFVWPTLPPPPTGPLPLDESGELQAVLDHAVALRARFPRTGVGAAGITAAVLTGSGVWAGAAGVDGRGRRLRPDSTAGIAAVTTTFTTAEVLRLAGAGRIHLDAPLADYLPTRLTAGGATVRQFLGMRSGLDEPTDADTRTLAEAFRHDPHRAWSPDDGLDRYSGPVRAPGGPVVFSSLNAVLLGEAVERVTGRPLAAVLREDVVTPAALGRIGFWDEGAPDAAPARGEPDRELLVAGFARTGAGATGMTADATGLARWGWELYGSLVLPPETVADMVTPAGPGQITAGFRYGLGTTLFSEVMGFGDTFGHEGRQLGGQSLLAVVPSRQVAMAVLAVDDLTEVRGVAQDLFAALARYP